MSFTRLSSGEILDPGMAQNGTEIELFLKAGRIKSVMANYYQKAQNYEVQLAVESDENQLSSDHLEEQMSNGIMSYVMQATFRELMCGTIYELEKKKLQLDISDLPLIKDLILEAFPGGEVGSGLVNQLADWDIFVETIFYEAKFLKRENGLTSLDGVYMMVEDAVVAGKSNLEARMEMSDFRNKVEADLNAAEEINLYIRAQIVGALDDYDKEVFPSMLESWGLAENFLRFLMLEITQQSARKYRNFEELIVDSDDFEGVIVFDLQKYNRLLVKHGPEICKFFEKNTVLRPSGGLVSLWKSIYNFWLSAQVDKQKEIQNVGKIGVGTGGGLGGGRDLN